MDHALVLPLADPACADPSLTGGKGANLARLVAASFAVPDGFVITSAAFRTALDGDLGGQIRELAGRIDYTDAVQIEMTTGKIRELICAAAVPREIDEAVRRRYEALGAGYVAVRSSGTAEDLAEASFAGQHDTYLDVHGPDAVLDAVRRCWASMWTARATAYRQSRGFDHAEAALAVVVQNMVESDASGVMFTGNPMTAATDEVVINSSWGLGDAIVSGVVTPDQFIVKSTTMRILESTIGEKELRIDRAPGGGTVSTDTPAADRARASLDADQVRSLARLGLKVQKYYGGMPQDIEWALADGRLLLLQSRPVTGAEFSWDAEVNAWQKTPEDDDVVWTKAGAEEWWTGAITPLMFSYRAELWQRAHDHNAQMEGIDEGIWFWKYHRGEAYFNTKLHRMLTEVACPPQVRSLMLPQLAPNEREAALAAPFSYAAHLRKYLQIELSLPTRSCTRWFTSLERMLVTEKARGFEMLALDLTELTDDELVAHIEKCIDHEYYYYDELWIPMWIFGRDMSGLLGTLVARWYDGDNDFAGVELTSGVPKRTITQIENRRLWELSQRIRTEPPLREAFDAAEDGADFLAALTEHEAGRAYLQDYRAFVAEYGHRGGADRDLYYAKRAEDPSIDHRAMRSLLSVSTPVDPEVKEEEVNARREEVLDEVLANVRRKPLGGLRAELFKVVHNYVLGFIMARDNERELADLWSYVHKLGYQELGRRLVERGILEAEDDHYFLTKQRLYALLDGDVRDRELMRAKITARRRNFEGFLRKTTTIPDYIHRNAPLDFASKEQEAVDGVLTGTGTSRGTVTGRARVLHGVEEIGRVEEGDILICHATDPGWTPVFMVISGLVLETGGLLAHGSCLSREYGLPCVQVPRATTLIEDGAMITISGDSGTVRIEGERDHAG